MVETTIGYFGDERRRKVGQLLVERIAERQAVCLRKLGDDRAEQVKFRRFLLNDSVTVEEMVSERARLAGGMKANEPRARLACQIKVSGPMVVTRRSVKAPLRQGDRT